MNSKYLLIAGAFYNLAFAIFHAFFWKLFGWKGDLESLTLNGKVMQTAAGEAHGIWPALKHSISRFPMPTSARWVFRHWSRAVSVIPRTAVYGSVRTVVWQGSAGDRCPYADQQTHAPEPEYGALKRLAVSYVFL